MREIQRVGEGGGPIGTLARFIAGVASSSPAHGAADQCVAKKSFTAARQKGATSVP
jgi:hypothetical protein